MAVEPILHGLYLRLLDRGLPLGVRDYLDALAALRAGFGMADRARLLWLCQTLWARSEEDRRAIALEFAGIPLPTMREVERVAGLTQEGGRRSERMDPTVDPEPDDHDDPVTPVAAAETAAVHFAPASERGLCVPEFAMADDGGELFILHDRPRVPLRQFVLAWRRLRSMVRSGPATELDIPGTVADQCRTGRLVRPRFRPPRRNHASLTLLVDVSASMEPWTLQREVMIAALERSGLRDVAVYYFDNVPDDLLFATPALLGPTPVRRVLVARSGVPTLILGDDGAARGRRNPVRVHDTAKFLKLAARDWPLLAWVNPLSKSRWRGTSFDAVARRRGIAAFALDEAELVRAVDHLRGRVEE